MRSLDNCLSVVIVAALGTVLMVSIYPQMHRCAGICAGHERNTMMFAEGSTAITMNGSWAGVDTMFMESGMENNWMGQLQSDGQHQGQGRWPRPGRSRGMMNVKNSGSRGPERAGTLRGDKAR